MLNIAHRLVPAALLLVLGAVAGVRAQTAAAPELHPLSIGFLNAGSDVPDAAVVMDALRANLLENGNLIAALRGGAYQGITLSPCDSPGDMAQRMSIGEFDLAFATATIYARQPGQYTPLLQTHLPGDFSPPGRPSIRRGLVFAGAGSALFQKLREAGLSQADRGGLIRRELARGPIAVTWAESAAGYIFPRLKLAHDFGIGAQTPFWFCGADSEVIKAVVSGVAPVGACRKGEIDALLPDPAERARCVEVLFETDYFPTDPILVRAEFAPARSPIGSELKAALRQFFNVRSQAGGLRVEDASAGDYEALGRVLQAGGSDFAGNPAAAVTAHPATPALPAEPQMKNETTTQGAVLTPQATPDSRPALPPLAALDARPASARGAL